MYEHRIVNGKEEREHTTMVIITNPKGFIQRLRFLHHRAFSCRRVSKSNNRIRSVISSCDSTSASGIASGFVGKGRNDAINQASVHSQLTCQATITGHNGGIPRGNTNPTQNDHTWIFLRPRSGSVLESSDGAPQVPLLGLTARRSGNR